MFKQTLLVDFDETITKTRGFNGPPNPDAVAALNILKEKFNIVIFSCRANKNILPVAHELMLIEYLDKHGVYYDEISQRKPVFFAMIDDKSYNPNITDWPTITKNLLEAAN